MRKSLALISFSTAVSVTFAASGFDGTWEISFDQLARYGVTGEAIFIDGKGTLTFFAGGGASQNNACLNKRLPVSIKSVTDSEVVIALDGEKILKGCGNGTLILHSGADGTWSGTLNSGYAVTWIRK